MSTTTTTSPFRAKAAAEGERMARKLFHDQEDHGSGRQRVERHLSEAQVATLLAVAYELGAEFGWKAGKGIRGEALVKTASRIAERYSWKFPKEEADALRQALDDIDGSSRTLAGPLDRGEQAHEIIARTSTKARGR